MFDDTLKAFLCSRGTITKDWRRGDMCRKYELLPSTVNVLDNINEAPKMRRERRPRLSLKGTQQATAALQCQTAH